MKDRLTVTLRVIFLLLLAFLPCSEKLSEARQSAKNATNDGSIPYRTISDLSTSAHSLSPVVGVKLSNKGVHLKANMLVDTGTHSTCISKELADRLHLNKTGVMSTKYHKNVPIGELESLLVGNFTFITEVAILDKPPLRGKIDGVIGNDLLAHSAIMIDKAQKLIAIATSPLPKLDPSIVENAIPMSYDAKRGAYLVNAQLKGEKIRLLLDTGASDTLISPKVLSISVTNLPSHKAAYAGGITKVYDFKSDLYLNNKRYKDLKIGLLEKKVTDYDGILGIDFLPDRTIIDFPNKILYFPKEM